MVTTSSNLYWAPLKPRIRIYALSDDLYTSPIYSYNAFTDQSGSNDKPIALGFETSTTNVGQCFVTIEDADNDIDENTFLKGNRIFIEGSKDGSTWQPAFKGLHRGAVQEAIGENGRNLTFKAYNYLIRLNERIVKVNKESTKTGSVYNDTDTNMFTDNLINNILTSDSNYVYTTNETGGTGKPLGSANITASPVTQWIPKLDVEFGTLASAIDEILDYSGGLLTVNFADDQLVLYDPEQVTSATGVFMVTNVPKQLADEVNQTMYPLEPYSYEVHYDTDESANRLILPFKSPDSEPAILIDEPGQDEITGLTSGSPLWLFVGNIHARGYRFMAEKTGDLGLVRLVVATLGNNSTLGQSYLWLYNDHNTTHQLMEPLISQTPLYVNSTPGTPYPSSATQHLVLGMKEGDSVGEVLVGEEYWMILANFSSGQTDTKTIGWETEAVLQANLTYSNGEPPAYTAFTLGTKPRGFLVEAGVPEINLDWMVQANDRNGEKTIGKVERTVTSIPNHIDGLQTIQEYLYPRIYLASKPRFSFDYPSLSMPNKIPKAGDILCHMDTTVRVGTSTYPVQTSIVTSARFDFGQDSDGVLGLRKLGLSTAGIRKGYY